MSRRKHRRRTSVNSEEQDSEKEVLSSKKQKVETNESDHYKDKDYEKKKMKTKRREKNIDSEDYLERSCHHATKEDVSYQSHKRKTDYIKFHKTEKNRNYSDYSKRDKSKTNQSDEDVEEMSKTHISSRVRDGDKSRHFKRAGIRKERRDSSKERRVSSKKRQDSSRERRESSEERRESSEERRENSRERRENSRERRDSSRERRESNRERRNSSRERRNSSRERRNSSREKRNSSRERRDSRENSKEKQRYGKWSKDAQDQGQQPNLFFNNNERRSNLKNKDFRRNESLGKSNNISNIEPKNLSDSESTFHEKEKENDKRKLDEVEPLSKRQKIENINMRTGGAYIPPARLRMMQESIKDKGSEEFQRIAWEALKKSIVGMTNKINGSNIAEIVPELFKENIIRGRGILARAIMQAQAASPTFTRVYAALVAIINTKFPEIGELILKRLIIQYKRGFRRNDKVVCMTAARFLAHLLNQEVAHEVLILEMITHLLENPTDDSVEVAIATLKECGKKLTQLTSRGMRAITQRVRDVLHEGSVDLRVRYMIEVFFAVQKDGFKDFEVIPEELDLVEEEDKYTHLLNLDDEMDTQDILNVFKYDPEYLENEEKYKSVAKEILGDASEEEGSGSEADSEDGGDDEEGEENKGDESQQILDLTGTNIVCLRRKIYLTIQSSLDFEECAHKLMKLELKPGQILEMCYMILDCCAQQRTYEKFFGLLAQRFCQINKVYVEPFTEIFENSYKTIHRLETNKLRNVAKFFAHLLYTDAISWMVLAIIKLNEEDTTSSSRIFIKILFQELCEYMGLPKLNERVKDVTLQEAFDGLFPRDHPHNTRFAINFFTSIGLGGLTDELREHLKNLPKNPLPIVPSADSPKKTSTSDSSSSSSTSSTSDSSSSSSDSDSEEISESNRKQMKKQKRKKK